MPTPPNTPTSPTKTSRTFARLPYEDATLPPVPEAHIGSGGVSNHALATDNVAGFMSPEEKIKLAAIDENAQYLANTDSLNEGSTNRYFTTNRVLNSILTGFSVVTAAAITAGDTVLEAFKKIQAQLETKVDKVTGKGLSDRNFTQAEKDQLAGLDYALASKSNTNHDHNTDELIEGSSNFWFTRTRVMNAILTGYAPTVSTAILESDTLIEAIQKLEQQNNTKESKISGKGLSTNDFTNALYDKLGAIETGATANQTNAYLQSRSNHTGLQAISTISGLQTALDSKPTITLVSGVIPAVYLPSFVDDFIEYADLAAFPVFGESGKMYLAIDTGKTYRWTGSVYGEINGSPGSTDAVVEGVTNLYHTAARVLATLLSGLSTATSTVITSADTVLTALGKLQAQIALRATLASPSLTGIPLAPTAAVATSTTQIATTAFTQAAINAFGVGVTSNPLIADFDLATNTGFYRGTSATLNAPTASTYNLISSQLSSASVFQLASVSTANTPRVYARSSASATFTAWAELAQSGSSGKLSFIPAANIGGSISQGSSKSTSVTLSKATGQITTHAASLAAGATVFFTLNNSVIAANDLVIVNRKSGGTDGVYRVWCDAVAGAGGSCVICIQNTSGGALAEALVLQFGLVACTTT